eukprot:jgi/Galph1/3338/GphlegSOOS_G2006.1
MNIFVPCPSNGNFEIVFTRESPAATCKPGAVIFCSELNQAGNCWCRNECVKEGNCCPQICASEFCSLGLDISDMCHEMKKNLTIPQTFLSCPAGTGPSDTSCSQHGVCSVTEGVCHCFDGFLPPDCVFYPQEDHYPYCVVRRGTTNVFIIVLEIKEYASKEDANVLKDSQELTAETRHVQLTTKEECVDLMAIVMVEREMNQKRYRCQCEPGWDGLTCTCGHSTNNDKDVFQNSSCPKLENAKYRKNQTLKFTQTIPDWPISVPLPKPGLLYCFHQLAPIYKTTQVSREQAILYFNQTIDMSLYDFTQEKWKIIAVNLASKLNTSTSRIFLVYFSKLQSIRKSDSSKTCLQTGSCSVDAVTFDSIKNGKTSIGVAVLKNHQAIAKLQFSRYLPCLQLYKLIQISTQVVGCFILTICSTMSVSAIKNEVRGIKGKRRQWIPVPGAEEDPRAIMLEELILTGYYVSLQSYKLKISFEW